MEVSDAADSPDTGFEEIGVLRFLYTVTTEAGRGFYSRVAGNVAMDWRELDAECGDYLSEAQ